MIAGLMVKQHTRQHQHGLLTWVLTRCFHKANRIHPSSSRFWPMTCLIYTLFDHTLQVIHHSNLKIIHNCQYLICVKVFLSDRKDVKLNKILMSFSLHGILNPFFTPSFNFHRKKNGPNKIIKKKTEFWGQIDFEENLTILSIFYLLESNRLNWPES